jgi:hypothetical protein
MHVNDLYSAGGRQSLMLIFANTLILINNFPAMKNIVAQKKAAV